MVVSKVDCQLSSLQAILSYLVEKMTYLLSWLILDGATTSRHRGVITWVYDFSGNWISNKIIVSDTVFQQNLEWLGSTVWASLTLKLYPVSAKILHVILRFNRSLQIFQDNLYYGKAFYAVHVSMWMFYLVSNIISNTACSIQSLDVASALEALDAPLRPALDQVNVPT